MLSPVEASLDSVLSLSKGLKRVGVAHRHPKGRGGRRRERPPRRGQLRRPQRGPRDLAEASPTKTYLAPAAALRRLRQLVLRRPTPQEREDDRLDLRPALALVRMHDDEVDGDKALSVPNLVLEGGRPAVLTDDCNHGLHDVGRLAEANVCSK